MKNEISNFELEAIWVAKVVGFDKQHRPQKRYLEQSGWMEGTSRKLFQLEEDGYYVCCYHFLCKEEFLYYFRVRNGRVSSIGLADIENSMVEDCSDVTIIACCNDVIQIEVEKALGSVNELVWYRGKAWAIIAVNYFSCWQDSSGISGTGRYHGKALIVQENRKCLTTLRSATDAEKAKLKEKYRTADIAQRLKEIAAFIKNIGLSPSLPISCPEGRQVLVAPDAAIILGKGKIWLYAYGCCSKHNAWYIPGIWPVALPLFKEISILVEQ